MFDTQAWGLGTIANVQAQQKTSNASVGRGTNMKRVI